MHPVLICRQKQQFLDGTSPSAPVVGKSRSRLLLRRQELHALTTAPGPRRADLRPATQASPPSALRSTRVLDQFRERIRMLHYRRRTEAAYVYWCRAFIRFHGIRQPASMGGPEVEAFLG